MALNPTDGIERRKQPRRAFDLTLQRIGSALSALEHVGDGVILLERSCRIVELTESARNLLQTCGETIRVQNQCLIFCRKEDASQLETFIKWMLPGDPSSAPGHTFLVARTPPRRPLIVSAFRLFPPPHPG